MKKGLASPRDRAAAYFGLAFVPFVPLSGASPPSTASRDCFASSVKRTEDRVRRRPLSFAATVVVVAISVTFSQ